MSEEAKQAEEAAGEEPSEEEFRAQRALVDHQTDWSVLVLCVGIVLGALLLRATPARDGVTLAGIRLPDVCTVKRVGLGECPGCGLTRSFVLGVRMRPEAFRLHPAGPFLLLVVLAQLPYRAARLWAYRRRRRSGRPEPDPDRFEPAWRIVRWSVILAVPLGWLVKLALP